jgi:hypothetical protein
MRCRDTFPLSIVISCGAVIRASRFGPAPGRPELLCRPSSHQSAAGSDFKAPSRVPDLWLVLNDDFNPEGIGVLPAGFDRLPRQVKSHRDSRLRNRSPG